MKFELDLLENSCDYLYDSLDFYFIANEYGTHDQQRSNVDSKKKWKVAFIFLIQAIELLIKEGLYRFNHALVLENIDIPISDNNKTISFSKSLIRLNNFMGEVLTNDEAAFLRSCAIMRNDYVHYKVGISSPELKSKYCKLFILFLSIHRKLLCSDFSYKSEKYSNLAKEIIEFGEHYTVFRGEEYRLEQLTRLKEEIEINKNNIYLVTPKGKKYLRIKFGEENEVLIRNGFPDRTSTAYVDFDYCGDCAAKKGEYHLDICDWEICPICFGQALSCDCEAELVDIDGNIYESPYCMD